MEEVLVLVFGVTSLVFGILKLMMDYNKIWIMKDKIIRNEMNIHLNSIIPGILISFGIVMLTLYKG